MADEQEQATGLLDLPAELRNRIYALVTVQDGPIRLPYHQGGAFPKTTCRPPEPALLAVNRQIHMEAMGVFYGQNIFRVCDYKTAEELLEKLDRSHIERIRRLEILFPPSTSNGILQACLSGLGLRFGSRGLRKDAVWIRVPYKHNAPWEAVTDMKPLKVVDGGLSWVLEHNTGYDRYRRYDKGSKTDA